MEAINKPDMKNHKIKLQPLSGVKQRVQGRMKSKFSFENQFQQNHDFDHLIDAQYDKMMKEKEETPTLIIPKNFNQFVHSKMFKEFIKKTYEYCCFLNELETKYRRMQEETEGRVSHPKRTSLLRAEVSQLSERCREMSFVYSGILLSQGDYRYVFKDQYFFETMIYFLCQILKHNFDREEFVPLEQELNRVFRTNTFNLIKRRRQEDQLIKKFPAMKETKKNDTMPNILNKIMQRNKVPPQSRYESKKDNHIKPFFIYQSSFGSVRSRSPIMSLMFPSDRDKLFVFNQEVRRRGSQVESMRLSQVDFRRDLSEDMSRDGKQ